MRKAVPAGTARVLDGGLPGGIRSQGLICPFQKGEFFVMTAFLFYLSVVCAFIFPGALITAIRTTDENKKTTYLLLSCLTFGVIITTILLVCGG